MTDNINGILEVPTASSPVAPTGEQRGSPKRYTNLLGVSSSLRMYGFVIRALGVVLALGGPIYGMARATEGSSGIGVIVAVLALASGAMLFGLGMLIAAMGEGLLALADIAMNTAAAKLA